MSIEMDFLKTDWESPGALVSKINSWVDLDIHRRQERAMNWSEAINFYAGNQWIIYNAKDWRWESVPITDSNRFIDRPVTNHLLRWITINLSGFTSKPTYSVEPNSDDVRDKTMARVGETIVDYLWGKNDKDMQYYEAALWSVLTGTVFRKSSKFYTGKVDQFGNSEKVLVSEVINPFQLLFDGSASRFSDIRVFLQTDIRRIDDIRSEYDVDAPGFYKDRLAQLKPEGVVSNMMALNEGLKRIVDGGSIGPFTSLGGSTTDFEDSCLLKECYVAPSSKFPRGLMIHIAGEQIVYMSPVDDGSPYFYNSGQFWHPYTHYNYYLKPGDVYGIGLGQQLIKINRRLNSIDALLAYNRKTMAIPTIFSARGQKLGQGSMIGKPGQNREYDPIPGAPPPFVMQSSALSNQVMEERRTLLEDGEKIAMAGDIRSGQNPSGVNTVGQLQILAEQSQMARSKQIESWESFVQRSEYLDLLNFKDCYRAPDKNTYEVLRKLSKDLSSFDWESFRGNQLEANTTVRIEKGSTVPKSRMMRQGNIMRALQIGLLGNPLQDPYMHKRVLEEFGVSDIWDEANMDIKYAEWTIEKIMRGEYPVFNPDIHSADIQLPVLMRFMKDPKFYELDDSTKILFDKKRKEMINQLAKYPVVGPVPQPVGQQQNQSSGIPSGVPQ